MVRWLNVGLIAMACIAGATMKEFYDWTGADQSRPAPVVGWIALGILAADCAIIAALLRTHYQSRVPNTSDESTSSSWRFSIRHIGIATTILAVLLIVGRSSLRDIVFQILFGAVACVGLGLAIWFPKVRLSLATLVACQSLPYIWLLRGESGTPSNIFSFLAILSVFPSFFPSIFVSMAFRQHFEQFVWFSTLLTSIQFALGIWLSFRGAKQACAYCLLLATLSIFGSFVFHALMRA